MLLQQGVVHILLLAKGKSSKEKEMLNETGWVQHCEENNLRDLLCSNSFVCLQIYLYKFINHLHKSFAM